MSILGALIVAGAAIAVAVVLAPFLTLRSRLVAAMPTKIEFKPARVEDYPEADTARLTELVRALEALGFRHAMDYRIEHDGPIKTPGFGRLFVHRGHACYAEINQAFPEGRAYRVRCVIISLCEQDWVPSTTDAAATADVWLIRLPRRPWTSMPGAAPAELLQAHLERRAAIPAPVARDVSPDAYFAAERRDTLKRRDAIAAKSGFGVVFEFIRFAKNPRPEWTGELHSARRQ